MWEGLNERREEGREYKNPVPAAPTDPWAHGLVDPIAGRSATVIAVSKVSTVRHLAEAPTHLLLEVREGATQFLQHAIDDPLCQDLELLPELHAQRGGAEDASLSDVL